MGGDDPEFTDATRAAAGPVIAVLASYGLDGEDAFYAALEFWSAMHGFVLLEMTGVMNGNRRHRYRVQRHGHAAGVGHAEAMSVRTG